MLISLNWLKQYVDIEVPDAELIKLIGARLVEVEQVIDETHKYDSIYAVQVKTAEKIPDTHLTLCKIDDGGRAEQVERDEAGLVQVMCGAPNVHAGMFAVWIAPGALVPQTFRDVEPFKIGMRKMLKRYDSYGMLAGADELDLGDDHSGIVELDPATTQAGADFAKLFNLDDIILDIENKSLTHRPDTFGLIGFAREVAGILGQNFKTPDWYLQDRVNFTPDQSIQLDISVDDSLCPRYTAVIFQTENAAKSSPYLTKQTTLLTRSGMRPIDPVVDLTNYLMLLTGQPLHAFDYDKIIQVGKSSTAKVIVRAARTGETIELLDGTNVELNSDDIIITSNNVPVALAGAMGGASTAIDSKTQRVLLESATFSLYNLRKTQMAHGIFSEAITRFTKGQPVGQTLPVVLEFADLAQNCGLRAVACFDSVETLTEPAPITVSLLQINQLLGAHFSLTEAQTLLQNVEFKVNIKAEQLSVLAPFWRTDIHIAEDVIEELGRLSGYDNIQPVLPLHATAEPNASFMLKTQIRNLLSSFGANEALTYSFVHGNLLQNFGQDPANSYRIINSISPDLQYIRQSIVPSLFDKSYANLRAGYSNFAMFEMNQVYRRSFSFDEDGVPQNRHQLAFVYLDSAQSSTFYQAKYYLMHLLSSLGYRADLRDFSASDDRSDVYYEQKRSAHVFVDQICIGTIGEIKSSVLQKLKLPVSSSAFELNLDQLIAMPSRQQKSFQFSQYPFVNRDLTLSVDEQAKYIDYEAKIRQILEHNQLIYRIQPSSIYQPANSSIKHFSFHLAFAHPHKTLAKDEIQAIMKKIESIK